MPNYWIVGTTVNGEVLTDDFIRHGIWFANREDSEETIEKIKEGDRLILKKMLGQGAKEIQILAVGIVRKMGFRGDEFRIVFVDWLDLSSEDKRIPFHGLAGAINGPYCDRNHQHITAVFPL